ncbi:U4/U6 small nuclear ribonucleoprotein Prp3 isoform X2 [Oopsacas minuta]|uniref:U4/U6 small nuclear ribonucleoprotein Prp3 isoform X2 n=1 Tax=Oopsacas minuta TaxID=111878 RepID=A0AAV7K4V8_9METZ|nr:U4/U6 small nuclear ribonucleoprotein Prp3 isoform X2 [Oopsacas minuta]
MSDSPQLDEHPHPDQKTIDSMLRSAKEQLIVRQKELSFSLPVPPVITPAPPPIPPPVISHQKMQQMMDLQARIQKSLAGSTLLSGLINGGGNLPIVRPPVGGVIMNEQGRTVTVEGKAIELTPNQPTLKANIVNKQRTQFKQPTPGDKPSQPESIPESTRFQDARLRIRNTQRMPRKFHFNEKGKYIRIANRQRAKVKLEELRLKVAESSKKTGIYFSSKLALVVSSKDKGDPTSVPDIEWWDAELVDSYDVLVHPTSLETKFPYVSSLIEHPIQVDAPNKPKNVPLVPVMLTTRERKKLKRQIKKEKEQERMEKIQFGLLPKPEPKVRISNLMRVLGNEAVADPTKMEAHVRAQMAQRQRAHEATNEARKLRPDQRIAKKARKYEEDLTNGAQIAVFRILSLTNPAHKFKVEASAEKFQFSGCLLLFRDFSLVVVEGGPKGIRKYKHLLLNRIKWSGNRVEPGSDDESTPAVVNAAASTHCSVIWEGKNAFASFNGWTVKVCPSETVAREFLRLRSCEHYWDLAVNQMIINQEEVI